MRTDMNPFPLLMSGRAAANLNLAGAGSMRPHLVTPLCC
jgi:hypothetical protein